MRIAAGPYSGQRGIVEKTLGFNAVVRLDATHKTIRIGCSAVANYSAAARKAWKTMPVRAVGRPRGRTSNRRSITLRLDETIWQRFLKMEKHGKLMDRSAFIEEAIDAKLTKLER